MANKEEIIVDDNIEIEKDTFDKLDKLIKDDETLTKEELRLWKTVHMLPESFSKNFIKWIDKDYGK